MSFSTRRTFFWGYALEIVGYSLNLVLSKLVPLNPMELWIVRKPGLHNVHL